MKQFIRYLYEYQDGKRIRNVGFVKVEQTDESTIVHIHGKGLHLTEDKRLKVYIFYVKEGQCIGLWQGDIDHVNPAVNSRLTFTPEDTGRPSNYPLIEGVILENAGHRRFAAVWDDMPVAVERMQVFRDEPEPDLASLAARKAAQDEEEMRKRSSPEESGEDVPGEDIPDGNVPDTNGTSGEDSSMDLADSQEEAEPEALASEEETDLPEEMPRQERPNRTGGDPPIGSLRCIKIQRRDIAQLKRCEWRLANNSFLLHGYYSYHHLLLIQEGEKCWLGVPGIYHPREAQAAEAFGFPRFVRPDEGDVELTEEETNREEDFGYWCRPVRR